MFIKTFADCWSNDVCWWDPVMGVNEEPKNLKWSIILSSAINGSLIYPSNVPSIPHQSPSLDFGELDIFNKT